MLAVMLLGLWLPATLHCSLEAAGLIATQCADDCGDASHDDDGCGVVERGLYKSSTPLVKISAPEILRLAFLFQPSPAAESVAPARFSAEFVSEPQTLRRTWQFIQRAAPPCRAPSASIA